MKTNEPNKSPIPSKTHGVRGSIGIKARRAMELQALFARRELQRAIEKQQTELAEVGQRLKSDS